MADATHAIPDPHPQHKQTDGPIGLPPVPQEMHDEELELHDADPQPRLVHDIGAEHGLAALRDSPDGVKPYYPYSTLIRYAIKGAPGQRLLLEDIYYAIEQRFPYFKTAAPGWKNSVRHNLSLNPCFEKVARPLTDRGKGAYWTVNDNVDPRSGIHRDRKKKRRKSKKRPSETSDDARETPDPGVMSAIGPNGAGMPPQMMQPIVDEHGNRIAFAAWPGPYPGGMYPGVPGPRYVLDPNEEEHSPEFDESGSPIWRTVWLNELVKLRRATYEQDTTTGDPEWYRAMVERVRAAFLQPQEAYMHPGAEEGEDHPEGEEVES